MSKEEDTKLAERAIQQLRARANQLISEQNGGVNEKHQSRGKKSVTIGAQGNLNRQSMMVQSQTSIGLSAMSHGTKGQADHKTPIPFYKVIDEMTKKKIDKADVKDNTWFEEYFKLELSIEEKNDHNEKAKREIVRRTERYEKNQAEYRKQIELLHRELRVRKGLVEFPLASDANAVTYTGHFRHINENIENYENQLEKLQDEQSKELARKYKSLVSRTKKSIEKEKAKSGDKAAEEKERENELRHHLELITNIAQRIDNENRALIKKNSSLKSDFKAQENEREMLVKQLVIQKKDNSKLQDEIKSFKKTLKEQEAAKKEQEIDLDNIDDQGNKLFGTTKPSLHPQTEMGVRTGNMSATLAGRSTHLTMTGAGGLSRAASNQQSGPLVYVPQRKTETEEEKLRRYDRVMDKLRKMMQNERRLLKGARLQYNKELGSKTELEILLKTAVDKVKGERKQHKKQAQTKVYTTQLGLGVGVSSVPTAGVASNINQGPEEMEDLNQHERERVIELMLSQERVIALLYEKTFPMTSLETHNPAHNIQDMQQFEERLNIEQVDQNEENYPEEEDEDQTDDYNIQQRDEGMEDGDDILQVDMDDQNLEDLDINNMGMGPIQMQHQI